VDVTEKVAGKVSPDGQTIVISVSAANIGVDDPAPNKPKSLIANYRVSGEENTVTTLDGSTFAVSAPSYVPKTAAGYLYSILGGVWTNGFSGLAVFLYALSVSFAFNLGGVSLAIVAALLPFSTFWLIVPILMVLSAFQGTPYWVPAGSMSGGRRRRRR
jgi:non-ribosomal peptide synthetase component E (peptide arylation enzyme)